MKNKILTWIISISMLITICSIPVISYAQSSPSSWAAYEVDSAINEGLVTDSVKVDYQANITREQFCEMVVRAYEKISGNTANTGSISFNDTANKEILKAANLGIVDGYGNGIFAPNDLITREQIAVMLVRMIDKAVLYEDVSVYNNNSFEDWYLISDWALPSVNFAYDNEIMYGVDDYGSIDPLANTTCEQAILLINRTAMRYYGRGSLIQGSEVYQKINDVSSALSAIDEVADQIGISDVEEELDFADSNDVYDSKFYSFQQVYQDLQVYGRGIVVGADNNNDCSIISNNYLALNADVLELITIDEAMKSLNDEYSDIDVMYYSGKYIYSLHGIEPQVCYRVYVSADDDNNYVFVSAIDGQILDRSPINIYDSVIGHGNDIDNNAVEFNTYIDDNKTYYLDDIEKNIYMYDANNGTLKTTPVIVATNGDKYSYTKSGDSSKFIDNSGNEVTLNYNNQGKITVYDMNGNIINQDAIWALYLSIDNSIIDGALWGMWDKSNIFASVGEIKNKSTKWTHKKAVTVMTRLEKLYDFYHEVFHRDGYDNKYGQVIAVVNDNLNGDKTNAYSCYDLNGITLLSFGTDNSLSYDTIGHEYRHSVTRTTNDDLEYKGESGALNEAYSDIFGELFEDWVDDGQLNNTCDWIHNNIRNLINPLSSGLPSYYNGTKWYDTTSDDKKNDYGGVHTNNTVISHAAYLMVSGLQENNAIQHLTTEQLAELFYTTGYILPYTCSFNEFSEKLYFVANYMYQNNKVTAEQLMCVAESLDEVGLRISGQAISGKVVDENGIAIENATVTFTINDEYINSVITDKNGTFSSKLPIGTYRIVVEKDGYVSAEQGAKLGYNINFVLLDDIVLRTAKQTINLPEGWYAADTGAFESYGMNIESVSSDSVTFYIEEASGISAVVHQTDSITAAIINNTVEFEWEDSWGCFGTGSMAFKDGYIELTMNELGLNGAWTRGDSLDGAYVLYPIGEDPSELFGNVMYAFMNNGIDEYLYYLPDDYDGDGKREAFVITGDGNADELSSNVDIWFVGSDGNTQKVKSGIYGILKESISTSNGKFITWCVTAGGSGTSALVLGCKNGSLFEPNISGVYAGFGDRTMDYMFSDIADFDKLNCNYIGYYSYFADEGGHIWSPIAFDYVEQSREFIQMYATDKDRFTYLENLIPIYSERYTGNEGDSFIDKIGRRNGNIDVDGNSYNHGLTGWVARWNYTNEISWVWTEYELDSRYEYLQGDIVLIKSYNENNFNTELKITGDGKEIYSTILTPDKLPIKNLNIDVKNIDRLKISFQDKDSVSGGTAFGLADFRLTY